MPQLEITTFPSQVFWLVVSFLILYLLLSKIIVPRISSVVKSRESEIKNNIHISEQLYRDTQITNDEIDNIKEETNKEAKEIINNLKEITNKKINQNYDVLKKKLEQKLEKDEKKITLSKKKAIKEINKISLILSEEIIKKLSDKKLTNKNKLKSILKKNIKEINDDYS